MNFRKLALLAEQTPLPTGTQANPVYSYSQKEYKLPELQSGLAVTPNTLFNILQIVEPTGVLSWPDVLATGMGFAQERSWVSAIAFALALAAAIPGAKWVKAAAATKTVREKIPELLNLSKQIEQIEAKLAGGVSKVERSKLTKLQNALETQSQSLYNEIKTPLKEIAGGVFNKKPEIYNAIETSTLDDASKLLLKQQLNAVPEFAKLSDKTKYIPMNVVTLPYKSVMGARVAKYVAPGARTGTEATKQALGISQPAQPSLSQQLYQQAGPPTDEDKARAGTAPLPEPQEAMYQVNTPAGITPPMSRAEVAARGGAEIAPVYSPTTKRIIQPGQIIPQNIPAGATPGDPTGSQFQGTRPDYFNADPLTQAALGIQTFLNLFSSGNDESTTSEPETEPVEEPDNTKDLEQEMDSI